jgi:hypothetical protein
MAALAVETGIPADTLMGDPEMLEVMLEYVIERAKEAKGDASKLDPSNLAARMAGRG